MSTIIEPSATRVIEGPQVVIPTAERSTVASPIGWASIFGATTVTVGVWLVLHMFGLGVGLTALDAGSDNSLRALGLGVGIWSLIAPIIALFVGGLVAGRMAPTVNTVNAAIHGAVTWALAMLATFYLVGSVLGSLLGSLGSAGAAVANDVAPVASSITDKVSLDDLGLDVNDLIAPVNQKLAAQGMPPVRAKEVEGAAKDALKTSVRTGHVDRETLVTSLADRTKLSRQDAEQLADQIDQRISSAKQRATEMADQAKTTAVRAGDTAGKILLGLSAMMVLGLAAAVGGSVLSVRRERREHVRMQVR